jgi:hypothetical protein
MLWTESAESAVLDSVLVTNVAQISGPTYGNVNGLESPARQRLWGIGNPRDLDEAELLR